MGKRRAKREYLLRGLIYCGCGRHLAGTMGGYYCTARGRHHVIPTPCKEPIVPQWLVESVTWDYVINLITSPEQFEESLRQAQAKELQGLQPKHNELEHISALILQTEKEADEIAGALTKTRGLVAARLEQQAIEVDRRYIALTTRQAELQEALTFELTDQSINDMLLFRETVAAGLCDPTYEDKRHWLEILQVEVTVKNRQAVIACRLSSEPFSFSLSTPNKKERGSNGGSFKFHTSTNKKHPACNGGTFEHLPI